MTCMWEKIKSLFSFIGRAWTSGPRGKWGIACMVLAIFFFGRMFVGDTNVQRFVMNIWHLNNERVELETLTAHLDALRHHIKLLQDYSPDYVEEIGLQYLNIGDAKYKILKI